MKCLIVDDEEMSRRNLEHLCTKIDGLEIVAICENGIQAISELDKTNVDLLFLDIEMPDLTGMEMVKSLSNLPQIIFITNRTEFALEAFEYDITDYLAKPVTLPRLIKAVNKAKTRLENGKNVEIEKDMFIRTNGKLVKLKYEEILYIETMDDYLIIHLENGIKHIIHSTLSSMVDKLQSQPFLKIHRSFIINLRKITSIEDTHVLIEKKVIPVSRANRNVLMEKVNLL